MCEDVIAALRKITWVVCVFICTVYKYLVGLICVYIICVKMMIYKQSQVLVERQDDLGSKLQF